MMWVKLSLPPRVRVRWLLAILRLTSSSFAGTGRTDVAVGTVRLAAMFFTIAEAAPRIGSPGNGFSSASETDSEGVAAAAEPGDAAGVEEAGADGAGAEVKRSLGAEASSAPATATAD